jgi:hypothetical protein
MTNFKAQMSNQAQRPNDKIKILTLRLATNKKPKIGGQKIGSP